MTRASRFALLSSAVVMAGAGAAAAALLLAAKPAPSGPLPEIALVLPADARFVLGLDVRRFTASDLHKRYTAPGTVSRPEVFKTLEALTGLVVERDLDRCIAAGMGPGRGLAMLIGRFDPARLRRVLDGAAPRATRKTIGKTTFYVVRAGDSAEQALAILDGEAILMGSEPDLVTAVQSAAAHTTPLRANPALLAQIERVRPGATFWMVGDAAILSSIPASATGGLALTLPGVQGVVVSADLTPDIDLSAVVDTASERDAKNLAATVRGLVGLLTFQSAQKPQLATLANAIHITPQGTVVLLEARLSYDLLDALGRGPSAPPAAPR
jgi:hypothetical protein